MPSTTRKTVEEGLAIANYSRMVQCPATCLSAALPGPHDHYCCRDSGQQRHPTYIQSDSLPLVCFCWSLAQEHRNRTNIRDAAFEDTSWIDHVSHSQAKVHLVWHSWEWSCGRQVTCGSNGDGKFTCSILSTINIRKDPLSLYIKAFAANMRSAELFRTEESRICDVGVRR